MKKSVLIASGVAVAIAVPALAQMGGHMMKTGEPKTRAEVEARIKEHFAKVDANGDGFVVMAEAEGAREKMTAAMRDSHFDMLDANHDGSISRAEFDAGHQGDEMGKADHVGEHKMGMARHHGRRMAMGGGHMFERADANSDGKVTLGEAMALPLAHFDKADANHDGTLTPEERKAAHEKMREMWRDKRG